MPSAVHQDDVGTELLITVKDQNGTVIDLSAATVTLLLRKPTGTVISRTPTLKTTGLDGKLSYLSVADDFDRAGSYAAQLLIVIGSGSWHSDAYEFTVAPNLTN